MQSHLSRSNLLRDVFSVGGICSISGPISVPAVVDTLVGRLKRSNATEPSWHLDITQSIAQRESYGTSAIGKGLAFPHLRSDTVDRMVGAIGLVRDGCQFGALDNRLTRCVFLTISPIQWRQEHGLLLQRLFGFVRDERLELLIERQAEAEEIWKYIMEIDARSDSDIAEETR